MDVSLFEVLTQYRGSGKSIIDSVGSLRPRADIVLKWNTDPLSAP